MATSRHQETRARVVRLDSHWEEISGAGGEPAGRVESILAGTGAPALIAITLWVGTQKGGGLVKFYRLRPLLVSLFLVYLGLMSNFFSRSVDTRGFPAPLFEFAGLFFTFTGIIYFFIGQISDKLDHLNPSQAASRKEGIERLEMVDTRTLSNILPPYGQVSNLKVCLDRAKLTQGIVDFIEELFATPSPRKIAILLAGSSSSGEAWGAELTEKLIITKLAHAHRQGWHLQVRRVPDPLLNNIFVAGDWVSLLMPIDPRSRILVQVRFEPHSPPGLHMLEEFDRLWSASVEHESPGV